MDIFFSQKLKLPNEKAFNGFIQEMANRIAQGYCRYGPPKASRNYLDRMKLEMKAYEKTGNREHLRNIANYCHLEDYAPQHKKSHFDSTVKSVTRERIL